MWTINLRAWIFGLTCLVFKTTCIDRRKPLHEGAFPSREGPFSLRWIRGILAIRRRGLRITSERDIGELDMRCLSTISRGQHSRQQSHIGHWANLYRSRSEAILRPLLHVGIKVVDEWQISLDYVRGSNIYVRGYLDLRTWSLKLRA